MAKSWMVALAAMSSAAAAGPINLKVQKAPLHEVGRKLSEASGCQISAWGNATIDLDLRNVTLWEALARLEVDHGIHTRFRRGGQLVLEGKGAPTAHAFAAIEPQPTWTKHWRAGGDWAIALLGDTGTRARLVVLGHTSSTIHKVVIDKAVSGAKPIKVSPGIPVAASACEPAVVQLELDGTPSKLTLRGHVIVKQPKVIEKRVAVPFDDSVVDLAEGRLRIHIASKPRTTGSSTRTVMVNWDGMGEAVKVTVQLVDDQGAPISSSGGGSGFSSSGQAHQTFYLDPKITRATAILKIPGAVTTDEKIPFRFDNEPLDAPSP